MLTKTGPCSRRHELDVDAGLAEEVELGGPARLLVDADEGRRRDAESRGRQRAVRDAATEPPAARVVVGDVARGRADDDGDRAGPTAARSVIGRR